MALYPMEQYWIARAALVGLTLFASFTLFVVSLCRARTRRDPARTAFTFLKAAFAIFSLFCCFDTVQFILAVISYRFGLIQPDALNIIGAIASLMINVTDVLILMILPRVAAGILIAHSGEPRYVDKLIKIGTYGAAVVLVPLAIASTALQIKYYYSYLYEDLDTIYNLITAFRSLVFAAAVLIGARAVMVKYQTRSEKRVATVSTLLIVSSVFWLLRTTYGVVTIATIEKNGNYRIYHNITEVVFAIWPAFIALCIILAIGTKKQDGLWSTAQAFTMPNQQTPWNYNNNATQPLPQHIMQQYAQAGWYPAQQAYYPPQVQQSAPQQFAPQRFAPQQYAPQQQPLPPQQVYVPPSELSSRTPNQHFSSFSQDGTSNPIPPIAAPPLPGDSMGSDQAKDTTAQPPR
ncbi:hypothetical protein G7Z17_g8162 [Cylindrodendrum hubeiense]|uniref:Uncharacterized protein n=1 Tax=Cylindrodendrum hubeiense TaxID=595255 RepID=A0A9P5H6G8_9HYPO|nr:hypothetical protein G7Z17_g8162 [Cylindrodendrum hubeiense]